MSRLTIFVDVILPLALPNTYTYRIPVDLNDYLKIGQRVIVQFGKNKLYTAIVYKIHGQAPAKYEAKYIETILDELPVVTQQQLDFWEWMSAYYCCYLGEVMVAALPASLKLASETKILLQENAHTLYQHLTDKELVVFDALALRNALTLKEVSEILDQKTVYPLIKNMLQKGVIAIEEEVRAKYKIKQEEYVQLSRQYLEENELKQLFDVLVKAPKQLEVLMRYLQLIGGKASSGKWIKKLDLQKACDVQSSLMSQLVKKGVFDQESFEVSRLPNAKVQEAQILQLSTKQQEAFDQVKNHFENKEVVLLHGVTSSGKTEIYVKLIEETIAKGGQALYLLPEIALTTQLIFRLQKYFGDAVGVYHSKFNTQERAELWNNVLQNKRFKVIIGARSALFLPFQQLKLVIVDEEHESSFKQYDPAPRYQARDAVMVLAARNKAKVLLGSATPSLESYWNALQGKYGLVELFARFGEVQMPEIILADTKLEQQDKTMQGLFSAQLVNAISSAFDQKEQVILFQNRRGYSPRWQCETCAWTPMCHQCDISLTYHKASHKLSCHYCGYLENPPKVCSACGSSTLKMVGFGTEKIEEELAQLFPDKQVARMDYDTTRAKYAYAQIINDFEQKEIDVLVGTQMVSKGLDFDNVGLVGILDAGQMLHFPDFRAYERAFQLMAQVAGRAGRKQKRGKVIIQTNQPNHWVLQHVIDNDYKALYHQEITERANFQYPPFFRLLSISIRHVDKSLVELAADDFANRLKAVFGTMVLGPEFPSIARIRNFYHKNIMIKFPRDFDHSKVKKSLLDLISDFNAIQAFKALRLVIDVDPV